MRSQVIGGIDPQTSTPVKPIPYFVEKEPAQFLDLRVSNISEINFKGEDISGIMRLGAYPVMQPVIVEGKTSCDKANFNGIADWSNVIFKDEASFSEATYHCSTEFNKAIFEKYADFSDEQFYKRVSFDSTIFKDEVDLSYCYFSNSVNFKNSTFYGYLDISGIQLSDSAEILFRNTRLPDTIDLSQIRNIKNEIDLTLIAFDSSRIDPKTKEFRRYCILVSKTDISKLHLDYRFFKILILNYHGQLSRDEASALYESFLKNFKDRGQLESAEKLDIEYQKYMAESGSLFNRIAGKISELWWEFGYSKDRIFKWTFFFLILFTLFTIPLLKFLQKNIYEFKPIADKAQENSPYKPITRRLWYSLVYTANLFFRLTLKTEQIQFDSKFKNIMGTLYVILVYVVGIVCIAYMANFVIQN